MTGAEESRTKSRVPAALFNALIVLLLIIVPLALGILVVGPGTPSGRNTRSATRVGHKVIASLYEELGYKVHRFERGLESPPREHAVLIALEPGPALLRDDGRYAHGLLDFVAEGNAALITLGPDTDHSAEIDDRDQLLGDTARRAIEAARGVEERAKKRARDGEATEAATSTDAAAAAAAAEEIAGDGRLIDRPIFDPDTVDPSDSWDVKRLGRFLDLTITEGRLLDSKRGSEVELTGPLAEALADTADHHRPVLKITRPRVFNFPAGQAPNVLLEAGGKPILFELDVGAGKLLALSEPRIFQNGAIGRVGHARLAVRIAERLTKVAGVQTIYFEEFSHGGREAANIFELAIATAAKWPLLQVAIACLVWVALAAGRRRSIVPFETPPRRSRHEVIDAMASLFLRSGDTSGAAKRLDILSRLRLARALGAVEKAGATAELAQGIVLRTGKNADEVRACLEERPVATHRQLVERAERLRRLRTELDDR